MKGLDGQFEDSRPDDELIKGYLAGRADDFNVLYERYKLQLYSYLNRLLPGRSALADDLFQQTWIKAVDQLGKYQNRQKFTAWLMRIAHNLAIDQFRSAKSAGEAVQVEELEDVLFKDGGEPWRDLHGNELSKALESALAELSPELREVFLLRQEDVSFKEIADIQGCSINTALSRMQYALRNLRKLLADWQEQGGTEK